MDWQRRQQLIVSRISYMRLTRCTSRRRDSVHIEVNKGICENKYLQGLFLVSDSLKLNREDFNKTIFFYKPVSNIT